MTTIQQLKKDALALRKIADKVLEQVERLELPAATSQLSQKKAQRDADVTFRMITGRRKPTIK